MIPPNDILSIITRYLSTSHIFKLKHISKSFNSFIDNNLVLKHFIIGKTNNEILEKHITTLKEINIKSKISVDVRSKIKKFPDLHMNVKIDVNLIKKATSLQRLTLPFEPITKEMLSSLKNLKDVKLTVTPNYETIKLSNSNLNIFRSNNLTRLDLYNSHCTDCVTCFDILKNFPNLKHFRMRGVTAMRDICCDHAKNLEVLFVDNLEITDNGIKKLTNVKTICGSGTNITVSGIKTLTKLKILVLFDNSNIKKEQLNLEKYIMVKINDLDHVHVDYQEKL